MIPPRLLKNHFIQTLTTLLITLLISACGAEGNLSAATVPDTNISIDTDTTANNVAVITGVDRASVTEDVDPDGDNLLEVGGKLNITDSNAGEAAFIAKTVKGHYGSLVINTAGNWSYAADNNQAVIQNLVSGSTLTDSLIVSSVDGTTHTVAITIIGVIDSITTPGIGGTNKPAVITGVDSGSVTEDIDPDGDNLLEVIGKLYITDSDAGEAAFIAKTVKGHYGNLVINTAGNWIYAANNNQAVIQNLVSGTTLTDKLIINSVDGTAHTIVITIIGINEANNPAIITGLDRASVTKDVDPDGDNLLEVGGKLNITDSDAGEAAFIAKTVNGNYGSSLVINTAGDWSYAADNNQAVIQNLVSGTTLTDRLTINSVDGTAHTVVITILGADENNASADITLSWTAPAEREDNTAISLSEIAGYKIYFGTTQGQYSNNVTINDGTAVGYTVTGLPAGTHYFVVTTIDTEGRESQYSSVVTIII
jgi:VCBS repeat-containing protein